MCDAAGAPVAGPAPAFPEPALGTPVQPACRMTREELATHLSQAPSEASPMFAAYFAREPAGGIVCCACRQPIGQHPSQTENAQSAAAANGGNPFTALTHLPVPSATISEHVASQDTQVIRYPAHWRGSAWWLPLVEFDRFGKRLQDMRRSTKRRHHFHGTAILRCKLPTRDGTPCDRRFEIRGYNLGGDEQKATGIPDFSVHDAHGEESLSIAAHMETEHDVHHATPGGWTTGFCDCCDHPCSVLSLLLSYPCLPACCVDNSVTGMPFAWALGETLVFDGTPARPLAIMRMRHPDHSECTWGYLCNWLYLPFAPMYIMINVLTFVLSLVTLCGFPCEDDCPPIFCATCWQRRRMMVKNLGADEDALTSRCAVVFCCALSELQVWREARYSGVWPGLCCRAANDDDRAAMSPGAVRSRYGLDGHYGVRFGPSAPDEARIALAEGLEPRVAYPDESAGIQ